jgi:hypothetical protein
VAHKHGAKLYFQLLLDPNRAALMEELAEKQGYTKARKDGTTKINTTQWLRDALYKYLSTVVDESLYKVAAARDAALWQESVRKRVEGRSRAKSQDSDS